MDESASQKRIRVYYPGYALGNLWHACGVKGDYPKDPSNRVLLAFHD